MDEKKLKALAAALAKGIKTAADLNQSSRKLTKLIVETALNAQLTEHLGHENNRPKAGTDAGETDSIPILKTFTVFNVEQINGLPLSDEAVCPA